MRTLWRLACHNTPGEGLVPATVMNRSELLGQAEYHKLMAKQLQRFVTHHNKSEQGFLKRAKRLKQAVDEKRAKKITDDILENLVVKTSEQ